MKLAVCARSAVFAGRVREREVEARQNTVTKEVILKEVSMLLVKKPEMETSSVCQERVSTIVRMSAGKSFISSKLNGQGVYRSQTQRLGIHFPD